jgi:hypothetical protein
MPSSTFAAAACLLASALQLASAGAIPRLDSEIDTIAMLSARSTSTSGLSHPERIILYVIAGVAGFLIIIGLIVGFLRSRHYRAGENQARGITKAILKKIPIIQYDPQTTPKSSLDGSVDSDSDSNSVLDEKHVQSMSNHTCPICTEDFVQYQLLRVLPCGHQYHMKCIEDWLQRGSSCPIWYVLIMF